MLRPFQLPSGAILTVESDATGFQANSALDALNISSVLAPLAEFCDLALQQLQTLAQKPDEVNLKLGVKLGIEGQIIIAKGSSEANLEVTLSFKRPQ